MTTETTTQKQFSIEYPRRKWIRRAFKMLGLILGFFFARIRIKGKRNLPKQGPAILVGNHVAVVEAAMMAIYVPFPIEMMAAGDIPLDNRYRWATDLYGYIPIKRGSMDRDGLKMALDVLEQGGIVGLFPEGGIWETNLRDARAGVAWLSSMSQAPVYPIGFGGIEGALEKVIRFKRPKLTMNIGEAIPPVPRRTEGKSRKQALADSANEIMDAIKALLPEDERKLRQQNFVGEDFDFELRVVKADGTETPIAEDVDVTEKVALSKLFHRPVMFDVFNRNLGLKIDPLLHVEKPHNAGAVADAVRNILKYLETNPYFFHYRFGNDEGAAMIRGLKELEVAARWVDAQQGDFLLRMKPIRRYTLVGSNEEVIMDTPAPMQDI